MSAAVAAAVRPARAPAAPGPRRHLEPVAPPRARRRVRPRLVHVVVVLGGVVGILLAQLGLSIAVADGAYRISSLQGQERELDRQEDALAERLESLASPQFLAANAEALGMVASAQMPYLDVASGAVSGAATAAGGAMPGNRITNVTTAGVPLVAADAGASTGTGAASATTASATSLEESGLTVVSGDASAAASGQDGGAGGTIPSPTTR